MTKTNIESQLSKVGLPAKVVERASDVSRVFTRGRNENAFLMDIRKTGGEETFVIRPGNADVQILNTDKEKSQAVLFVGEKATEVEFMAWDNTQKKSVPRIQKVPAAKRHFLIGMDECHLFVCQLPKPVATVAAAHEVLAPENIHNSRVNKKKVIRQGEWFFEPVKNKETLRKINAHAKKVGVLKKHRIGPDGRRGRPHVADEMVRIITRKNLSAAEKGSQENQLRTLHEAGRRRNLKVSDLPSFRNETVEYVQGAIRHPDHHALHLSGWHSVSVNTEAVSTVQGMTWVD